MVEIGVISLVERIFFDAVFGVQLILLMSSVSVALGI